MVTKTSGKKTVRRSGKANSMYKVTAAYGLKFKTMSDARKAKNQIAKNKKAQISPIKKSGNLYTFTFKFVFVTPDAKIKSQAIKEIKEKSPSARITTGVFRTG